MCSAVESAVSCRVAWLRSVDVNCSSVLTRWMLVCDSPQMMNQLVDERRNCVCRTVERTESLALLRSWQRVVVLILVSDSFGVGV